MNLAKLLLVACLALMSVSVHAEKITIAAASDLKFALDEIISTFKQINPDDEVDVVYGSSGNFNTQIQQGAPYDLFFSADIEFPRQLAAMGFAASDATPYAFGRIVLWSATLDATKMTLVNLTNPDIKRIAIANPKHAPYGKRAEEALRASGLWDKIAAKLVYGETILQATQFVQTGNAQIGIIALSLAGNPDLVKKGGYRLIPDNLHKPLEQGFIITKRAEHNKAARRFADYMLSSAIRQIMTKYGFVLPGEVTNK